MTPTVGRIVHFYSKAVADRNPLEPGRGFNGQGAGPYVGVVTQVFPDANGGVSYANLSVSPPFADGFHEGSVPEKGGPFDYDGSRYWVWPPRD